ncbi:exodeoxyribonuclease I [Candidatus Steffania adelgidicola]|uniref:exodeoxyribonuclease I n=1 Tax=Candidatus Steffania adelgidicola TaxID=1076626 RepID=UPI001D011926|nr:exodeoxyribonuclease I [Candidatus Steffania adelgidicola]UDG79749.1 Exodeoxyribonuclease I [Candidatus Steffania adelgidicola]
MPDPLKRPTFLVHDYETFGKHPALDWPAQFSAIRTDSQFRILEEPTNFLCHPADDYLPDPEAVLITGITPQKALSDGISEVEFARRIYKMFNMPDTCILGYNNINFDDEVSRNLFYRNFYDPYGWSWKQGNSRWDLLDVMRACYALRPEGISWPINEEGLPSFRLQDLTHANGIEHSNAHDAMADVYATLEIGKLIYKMQPNLFNFLYHYRGKRELKRLIAPLETMTPLVHISGMFGAARGNTAWIAPLAWHPYNPNALIVCDLSGNIQLLEELDSDALRNRLYTKKHALYKNTSVPLKIVYLNKCPVLAPANTLRPIDAERLGIHRKRCLDNLTWLRKRPELRKKIVAVFSEKTTVFTPSDNVDTQLYDGFFSESDRATMNIILSTNPESLQTLNISFIDPRLNLLLFRYRARNFKHTLNHDEALRWLEHRNIYFNKARLDGYLQKIKELSLMHQGNTQKIQLLDALCEYCQI